MGIILSIDEEVVRKVKLKAEALVTSIEQLVREYLMQLAKMSDFEADALKFIRLSRAAKGNFQGWKYNREAAYDLE